MLTSGWASVLPLPWPTIAERDGNLLHLDLPGLFVPNTTRLALRRGVYLRSYAYEFIQKLIPGLSEEKIGETLRKEALAREDFVI